MDAKTWVPFDAREVHSQLDWFDFVDSHPHITALI